MVEKSHGPVESTRVDRVLPSARCVDRRPVLHEHGKVEGREARRKHDEHETRYSLGHLLLRGIAQDAEVFGQIAHLQTNGVKKESRRKSQTHPVNLAAIESLGEDCENKAKSK